MSRITDPITDTTVRRVRAAADLESDRDVRAVCDCALGLACDVGRAPVSRAMFDRAAARAWLATFAHKLESVGVMWPTARVLVPLALALLVACADPPPSAPDAPPPPTDAAIERCGAQPASDELLTFAPTYSTWGDGTEIVIFRRDRYDLHREWIRASIAWSDCAREAAQ